MPTYANVITGHTQGESFTFTMHTFTAAGNTAGAAAALHNAVGLLWNGAAPPADSIKQLVCVDDGIDLTAAIEIDPLTGKNLSKVETGEALVGTNASECLPPQCSCVVSLRTDLPQRAGRGRFYLPSFGVNQVSGGRILAAAVSSVKLAAQGMIQSLNGAGYTVVIYHRSTKTHDNVTHGDVGDVFDTQRRRRNKLIEVRSTFSV